MTKFLTDRDYTVVKAQELENIRRISVNLISIANFYSEFESIIPTDPRRIINIDETQIQSNRKFKCIIKKNRPAFRSSVKISDHLTGMIGISADGTCLKPMIILPSKKS